MFLLRGRTIVERPGPRPGLRTFSSYHRPSRRSQRPGGRANRSTARSLLRRTRSTRECASCARWREAAGGAARRGDLVAQGCQMNSCEAKLRSSQTPEPYVRSDVTRPLEGHSPQSAQRGAAEVAFLDPRQPAQLAARGWRRGTPPTGSSQPGAPNGPQHSPYWSLVYLLGLC